MTDKREVKCPHCGHRMQSAAKTHTSCSNCHKPFSVLGKGEKRFTPTPTLQPELRVPAQEPLSEVSSIRVEHVPEAKVPLEAPSAEAPKGPEEAEGAPMIPPQGLYSIFVQLPNDMCVMIYPEIEGQLEITPAEQAAMENWAQSLYDYCIRHGITIPDYLELLPIVLVPFGFHVKRVRAIMKKIAEDKEAKKPKPPPIPEGADVSMAAEREVKKAGVDMEKLEARMEHKVA